LEGSICSKGWTYFSAMSSESEVAFLMVLMFKTLRWFNGLSRFAGLLLLGMCSKMWKVQFLPAGRQVFKRLMPFIESVSHNLLNLLNYLNLLNILNLPNLLNFLNLSQKKLPRLRDSFCIRSDFYYSSSSKLIASLVVISNSYSSLLPTIMFSKSRKPVPAGI